MVTSMSFKYILLPSPCILLKIACYHPKSLIYIFIQNYTVNMLILLFRQGCSQIRRRCRAGPTNKVTSDLILFFTDILSCRNQKKSVTSQDGNSLQNNNSECWWGLEAQDQHITNIASNRPKKTSARQLRVELFCWLAVIETNNLEWLKPQPSDFSDFMDRFLIINIKIV